MRTTLPKLMPLMDWARARFTRPPCDKTLRRWCEDGEIPAKRISGRWYVDIEAEARQTGNPLVDQVLNDQSD